MKLLIDSGATKSEYVIIDKDNVVFRYKNRGINISYCSDEEVKATFLDFIQQLPEQTAGEINAITYYGAGCGKPENSEKIYASLITIFHNADIQVYSDLLAACHALCGTEPGWVAILGTGSASCLYDGESITNIPPSLGFMLGDEGSGTHLGKMFLTHYLSKKIPEKTVTLFEQETGVNREKVMAKIYRESKPNQYMASIAQFLGHHQDEECIRTICRDAFRDFFTNQLDHFGKQSMCENVNILGSVGFHFHDIVKEAAQHLNIR
ncbi:hypothetical protein LJC67_07815, partial [Bacteroidales bacterium OttesenSCG-928-A14]|nr:hypothetical protein [Bacteroidales bacterium OttesenSCG-928-A14]